MKTIAIIAAMGKEVELLLPLLSETKEETIDGTPFHTGKIGDKDVVIMQCGIGKVNAALGTQTLINAFHPSLVINTGVGGSTSSGAQVLDVVVATQVAYHDFYCLCEPWGKVPGAPLFYDTVALEVPEDVKRGLIVSGDLFVSRPEEVETILSHFPEALAVDMESGAIAQTCFLKHTPFACLRVLSDTPGQTQDNGSQYYDFWKAAPEKTFHVVSQIIEAL